MQIKKMSEWLAVRIVQLRFWALIVFGVAGLSPSMAMAQQGCIATPIVKTFESCDGPVGAPNRKCTYRSVLDRYDITCPPPQSMTPPAPPPTPPAPQPIQIKSAEEIEREAHVKFCKEFPLKIKNAVNQCISSARGYHGYFVATRCSGVTSQTWNIGLSVKDIFEASYSQKIEPGPTCREDAGHALEATFARCNSGGSTYEVALAQHCSDVN